MGGLSFSRLYYHDRKIVSLWLIEIRSNLRSYALDGLIIGKVVFWIRRATTCPPESTGPRPVQYTSVSVFNGFRQPAGALPAVGPGVMN
jgi:hypothetical protein